MYRIDKTTLILIMANTVWH